MKSFAKSFSRIVYSLDLFGVPVTLLTKGNQTYNTMIGSLLSTSITCLCIYSFYFLFQETLNRSNPTVVQKVEYTPNPEKYPIGQSGFFVFAGLISAKSNWVSNTAKKTFYTGELKLCETKQSFKKNVYSSEDVCQSFAMVPCTNVNLDSKINIEPTLLKQLKESSLCIDDKVWQKKKNFNLQGYLSSSSYTYIKVELFQCKKSTKTQKCVSQKLLDQQVGGGRGYLIFQDYILDQTNPLQPYQQIPRTYYNDFSSKYSTGMQIFFRNSYFQQTFNPFYYFSSYSEDRSLTLEYTRDVAGHPSTLLSYSFILDDKRVTYECTYPNILDILGNIGGLYGLLVFVFGSLISPLTQTMAQITLLKHNVVLDDLKKENRKATINPMPMAFEDNTLKGSKAIDKLIKRHQKNQKIRVNCTTVFHYIIGKRRSQLKQAIEKMENLLDVSVLIRKLIEIEKLKQLLMSEQQLRLFEYLPKHKIPIQNQSSVINGDQTSEKGFSLTLVKGSKGMNAYDAFASLITNMENPLSAKLIEQMDQEIKQIFTQVYSKIVNDFLDSQEQMQAQSFDEPTGGGYMRFRPSVIRPLNQENGFDPKPNT